MSLGTLLGTGLLSTFAAPQILAMSDRLQMVWIYAGGHSAQVVHI
jgi:hypothetical protein